MFPGSHALRRSCAAPFHDAILEKLELDLTIQVSAFSPPRLWSRSSVTSIASDQVAILASYLGLTPREYSSGLKRYLGRISKRGDGYLRTLLIHGARSILIHARKSTSDRFREWAHELESTHPHNKAAVAVANKMARYVWAVWTHQHEYLSDQRAAA